MDKELIREGKIALIAGVLLYLGATIAYNFFIGYVFFGKTRDLWEILLLISIIGMILIAVGIEGIIEGWISEEKIEESEEEENSYHDTSGG